MNCPLCKSKLETDPDEPTFIFEDAALSEIRTTKHICVNENCELNHKSYWNDYGDFFSGKLDFTRRRELFPDNTYGALNSMAKRHEVEIYKNGLRKSFYLSPWFTLTWLKPMIEFNYKGDEMGNILKRTYKLKFLYRSNSKEYTTFYTSSISSLFYRIKKTRRDINIYKKTGSNYSLIQIHKWYNFRTENLKCYEKVYKKYVDIFHAKMLLLSSDFTSFTNFIGSNKNINEETYYHFQDKMPDIDILPILLRSKCESDFINQKIRERKLKRILKKKLFKY